MFGVLRTLATALFAAPVLIGLALLFVLGTEDDAFGAAPVWAWAALVVVAAGSFAVTGLVGYRAAPLPLGLSPEDSRSRSALAYQSLFMLRFALTEAVAIVAVALAFVVPSGGYLLYLVGAVASLGLMWLRMWPDEDSVTRTERALEAGGAPSYLREAPGLSPTFS